LYVALKDSTLQNLLFQDSGKAEYLKLEEFEFAHPLAVVEEQLGSVDMWPSVILSITFSCVEPNV
jgi:hypothetical protein